MELLSMKDISCKFNPFRVDCGTDTLTVGFTHGYSDDAPSELKKVHFQA